MKQISKELIRQIHDYYSSKEYKEELKRNLKDTKSFLEELKERRKIPDEVLNEKFTI
jgi:hypothetical protein